MNPRNTLLVRAIIVAVIALPFCASSPAIAQDCNNNGIPDLQDIDPADPDGDGEVSADCNGNGVPDECEPDCNGNGIIDDCDLPSFFRKLTPSDAATGDGFGDAVAIDGNRIVVGASYDDDGGIDSGAAYIFQNIDGQWTEIAKLTADDATAGDLFGAAVTISGDTVAISATGDVGDGNDPGSVYVFGETDGIWQQVARLTPSDAAPGRRFGFSISIDGDTLAVGEPFGNNGITGTGAIYVFRRISGAWQEMTKLTPQPYFGGERFGESVSIDGNTIVGGARTANVSDLSCGAAFIFRELEGAWPQIARLSANDGRQSDGFGSSVSIDGTSVIVGAPGYDQDSQVNIHHGAAYIFQEVDAKWELRTQIQVLDPPNTNVYFASSVTICGNRAYVGMPRKWFVSPPSAAIYCYQELDGVWRSGGRLLTDANSSVGDYNWIAASDAFVVSGTTLGTTESGIASGSAVVFDITQSDCNNNLVPDACELSGNDCNENGIPDDCEVDCSDCNQDGVPDSCEIQACQPGDLACADCNNNGVPDECDPDCDLDGIPDACEIAACPAEDAACADCNHNGVPDVCDSDCNGNSIPDTCEVTNNYATLVDSNPQSTDEFGSSVAISGNRIIVGARRNFYEHQTAGTVSVFDFDNGRWEQSATLTPDGPPVHSLFGDSVSLSGNTAVVSALDESDTNNRKDVYFIFEKIESAWMQVAKFSMDVSSGSLISRSVYIEGDTAIVGSTFHGNSGGAAMILRKVNDTWGQVATLTASNSLAFGHSVALSGDTAVVGAYGDAAGGAYAGAAYVFRYLEGAWQQIAKLQPRDLRPHLRFGMSVSIEEDTIVVGTESSQAGSTTYIFRESDGAWQQVSRFTINNVCSTGIQVKQSVAIDNGVVIVGQPSWAHPPISLQPPITSIHGVGVVIALAEIDDVWQPIATLLPANLKATGRLGSAVAIDGNTVVAAAISSDLMETDAGAVSIFQLAFEANDCDGNRVPDDCDVMNCPWQGWPCHDTCGAGSPQFCNYLFNGCEDNRYLECNDLSLDLLDEFVDALLNASTEETALCNFDLDRNGYLDGRDVNHVTSRLLQ